MTLNISKSLSLPNEAARWSFADLAIKGAGKTYAASVLAEEMLKNGIPIVAIDGIGIWWSLRVGADKGKGLPVVVFGGGHADFPIPTKHEKGRDVVDDDKLKLIVKAVLQTGISVVLDTKRFSKGMQRRIVAVFVQELYEKSEEYSGGMRHVFIEEADLWAPQRVIGKEEYATRALGAIDDLTRRGGNFNLGCTLITQRSAVLNKDVLTQCNCLIVMRTLAKLDKDAVASWVKDMAGVDPKKFAKWYDSLRDLENGEAWIWHPETDLFKRIQFRKRETLHATREYFLQAEWEQKNVRMMDVEEFKEQFRKVFEPKPKVVEPVHEAPIQPQRIMVSQAPKQIVAETVEREMPVSVMPVPEITPTVEKTEMGPFKIEVSRLVTDSLESKVIFLMRKLNKECMPGDIIEGGAEYGWVINSGSLSNSLAALMKDGIVVKTAGRRYRFPQFIEVRESPI